MSDAFFSMDQASRARARLGTTLNGKYRLDSVLGMGGMAVVYAATHRNAKRFAVKMLHAELALNVEIRTRFLREGYAANSVEHPGTVAVLDDDVSPDGAAFIVMELLQGTSVDALLKGRGGTLPAELAVPILDQVLDVLSAAHAKGIVHRDIKPANLFAMSDGTVKVLDFGIARARDAAANMSGAGTGTGVVLGTPAFMAPEQALGKTAEIDERSDTWAAAATLFTLLSGAFVHPGDTAPQLLVHAASTRARALSSVTAGVPRAIAHVVERGLAFDKPDRWPSAAAMREALRQSYRDVYGRLPAPVPLADVAGDRGGAVATLAPGATIERAERPIMALRGGASGTLTAAPLPFVRNASNPADSAGQPRAPGVAGGSTSQAVSKPGGAEHTAARRTWPFVVATAAIAVATAVGLYAMKQRGAPRPLAPAIGASGAAGSAPSALPEPGVAHDSPPTSSIASIDTRGTTPATPTVDSSTASPDSAPARARLAPSGGAPASLPSSDAAKRRTPVRPSAAPAAPPSAKGVPDFGY